MKKWISILCIVLLLCSAVTVAVSAAGTGTKEDPVVFTAPDFNMVKIPAGETYYVSFVETADMAKRQISVNSSTDKAAGYTVTVGDTAQDSDADGYCNIVTTPDENNAYVLSITNKAAKQATFFVSFYAVSPYSLSDTPLYLGENAVVTGTADTTLYVFDAEETGIYEVVVDNENAILSYWNGSPAFVSGLAQETTEGKLEVICASVGQSILVGLSGVESANIILTKIGEYIPPEAVEYVAYVNKHTPDANFVLPEGEMTAVDITAAQTVVLGADGIYRYGTANGPIVYVDMTGVQFADLYECYYPATAGAQVADRLRGTYVGEDGKTYGYDFITAMRDYADALDENGYYYLTEDLANYIQIYGGAQGWFVAEFSPFEIIQSGAFNADSAWLVSACYDPNTAGIDPVLPDTPVNPDDPADPDNPADPDDPTDPDAPSDDDQPQSPATGDVASFGAVAALLLSSSGALIFCKKRY